MADARSVYGYDARACATEGWMGSGHNSASESSRVNILIGSEGGVMIAGGWG